MQTESSQLDQIIATLSKVQATVNSGRLFDTLEAVRDQVRDLKHQNHEIRNDLMSLQRTIFELNAGGKTAD